MSTIRVRCLLQQCTRATLRVQEEKDNGTESTITINRGMVAFVAFLKDAQLDDIEKLAKEIVSVKLCESDDGTSLKSIIELSGDLLLIPQATLGGRLNGRRFQYHNIIGKETGLQLYETLLLNLRQLCDSSNNETKCLVQAGTYGIRQIYSCETNGPSMHLIEF